VKPLCVGYRSAIVKRLSWRRLSDADDVVAVREI